MSNYDDDNTIDGTLSQVNSAKQIPQDLMLLKMENETIMAAAAVRPRKQSLIIAQLQDVVDSYPDAADDAIYAKPCGKETKVTCSNCKKVYPIPYKSRTNSCPSCKSEKYSNEQTCMKIAEGLSIRAAETIRSIYGYNRLAVTQENMPDGSAKITGTFIDYATGTMTSDTRVVNPFYTDRNKNKVALDTSRFDLAVKAEKAKLRRDVILDSISNNIKAAFRDMCEKKLAASVPEEYIQTKIIPAFINYGINLQHLEKIVGRPLAMGWTEEDRLKLLKVNLALKNKETTVAEVMAEIDAEPTDSQSDSTKKARVSSLNDTIGKKPEPTDFPSIKSRVQSLTAKEANELIKSVDTGAWTDAEHAEMAAILDAKEGGK